MNRKAFTLIEVAAVILIILILLGISLPLLNGGTSHHEAKLATHSIQSLISLCGSMARSSGKVYFLDSDYSSSLTVNSFDLANQTTAHTRFRFSVLRIYSATWDASDNKVQTNFSGEAYDVPVSIAASYTFNKLITAVPPPSDRIYFKPDGVISSDVQNIIACPETRSGLFYQIDLDQNSGSTTLKSFKDD